MQQNIKNNKGSHPMYKHTYTTIYIIIGTIYTTVTKKYIILCVQLLDTTMSISTMLVCVYIYSHDTICTLYIWMRNSTKRYIF